MSKKYNKIEVKDNMNLETEEEVETTKKREPLESVVSVQPTKVKRSLFGRLVTGVVGPEGLPGIGSYVNEEIVKPAIKNIIVDAVTSGINMVMYGDRGGVARGRGGYQSYSGAPRQGYRPSTNYGSNYGRPVAEPAQPERMAARAGRMGVQEYLIQDRMDASNVLASLTESAEMYGTVSVADYYDSIGVPSVYTDNNHGWSFETINRAVIVPARGGFVIRFPIPEVI